MKAKEERIQKPIAVAFYHDKGLVPAWKQATQFAGKNGRIATIPDIVDARLATADGAAPWNMYFTTSTAEYVGTSKGGNKVIIVAHGIGPMSNISGISQAYSYEYKDKTRSRRGGRISQKDFLALESGQYGDVSVIDFDEYNARYQYSFIQQLRYSELLTDPLFQARFGPRYAEYLEKHLQMAREYHAKQANFDPTSPLRVALAKEDPEGNARFLDRRRALHLSMAQADSDPFLLGIGDAPNCCYRYHPRPVEKNQALAHLISVGRLVNLHHAGNESLVNDVDCHEWWNGVRFVGVRGSGQIDSINAGNYFLDEKVQEKWEQLMRPVEEGSQDGFFHLIPYAGHYFTEYPKAGDRMDSGQPQFLITKMNKIEDGPTQFRTTIGGYHGFVKYGIKEVKQIAPKGANAYTFPGEFQIQGEWHVSAIEFYQVEVDTSRRLLRKDEIMADYDLMLEVIGVS